MKNEFLVSHDASILSKGVKPAHSVARRSRNTQRISRLEMAPPDDTHSKLIGYILWIFGFMGAHRFYFGRPISGTIYFFTLGLFLIGWIVDLFLIPGMDRAADIRYSSGNKDYTVSWILLTFLGIFGIHRFYLGKWVTGLIWLLTGGLCLFGLLYDLWTLNGQIDEVNRGETL
jgi:TM2 domain-containing membrane protein YozV